MPYAIKAENISKAYRLGVIGTGTVSNDLRRWLSRKFGKGDSWEKLVDGNAPVPHNPNAVVWSLQNVSFQIDQGEAVAIIGENGAGKSTLLKILTRITTPTAGRILGHGKVASLLEVGTGFHPELTGRENIFLNGAILGMKRAEISKQFDAIVDFSGVTKYIDTPVKRYSSGMYVRLAFAVAAHLNPDILVIDEVLAVGDAEFQKKCLGKMNQVSAEQGRTVVFVSHNMQAVANLCQRAIWLKNGSVKAAGFSHQVVNQYLSSLQRKVFKQEFSDVQNAPGNSSIRVIKVELIPDNLGAEGLVDIRTTLKISFRFYNSEFNLSLITSMALFTLGGECIFDVASKQKKFDPGFIDGECTIPGSFLNDGSYYISLYFAKDETISLFIYEECLHFDIADYREHTQWYDKWWGYVRPNFPLTIEQVSEKEL